MLKKYILKMGLAAIFLFGFTLRFSDVIIGEKFYEHPLETAWKATGIPLGHISAEAWIKLNDQWMGPEELKSTIREAVKILGLKLQQTPVSGLQPEFDYVTAQGMRSDGTVFTLTLQSTRSDEGPETQMGINAIRAGNGKAMRNYIEGLKKQIQGLRLHRFQEEIRLTTMISGKYSGELSPLLFKELTGRAFQKIKAISVAMEFSDNQGWVKGYTGIFTEKAEYEMQPVNVEITARYNEEKGFTEVSLGTPALTEGT